MKATKGQGFDIVSPTNNRSLQWEPLELLQPFDMNKRSHRSGEPGHGQDRHRRVELRRFRCALAAAYLGYRRYRLWRTDLWLPDGDAPSYGDVWSEENAGKTMGRAHSMMLGAGLYMERAGEMEPGSVWAAYGDEDTMRKVWGQIADWCIARKDRIKLIWNDADTQKNGLLNEGVSRRPDLGRPTPGTEIRQVSRCTTRRRSKVRWPGWMACRCRLVPRNIDQIYAFIDFRLSGQAGRCRH